VTGNRSPLGAGAPPPQRPGYSAALTLLLAACTPALTPPALPPGETFDHAYAAWDALLARHVEGGRVAYDALAADRPALEAVIAQLAAPTQAKLFDTTRAQQTAFWINSYNALTLRVVLDHPGTTSIRDIGLVPYAAFREPVAALRAHPTPLSLDDIEKDRLLGGPLWDARIHMAVSCASASCPALLARAWRAEDLDATLDAAARAFLADPAKNRWDGATRTLSLSKIFEWYSDDFTRAAGGVEAWVARYAPPEMAAGIAAGGHTVVYLDYDWSLNAR